MSKRKLGKMESRSVEAMEYLHAHGSLDFRVEWVKSSTWGKCPRILWHGERAAHASGCGYDKLSAVVSEFLNPLGLRHTSGCGIRATIEAAAEKGWKLVQTYSGANEDGFRIERAAS